MKSEIILTYTIYVYWLIKNSMEDFELQFKILM